jgi:hypothetical protein
MTPDELGMNLHDRATRGLPLSPGEERQLQDWYDENDRVDAAMLGVASEVETLAEIRRLERQIEAVRRQNDELLRVNEALRANLAAHAERPDQSDPPSRKVVEEETDE